jgi:magnesium-transporting ATPase (P-type)
MPHQGRTSAERVQSLPADVVRGGIPSAGKPVAGAENPSMDSPSRWHAQPVTEVLDRLHTSPDRLSDEDAARRLAYFGANRLPPASNGSALRVLPDQFKSIVVVLLIVAAGIAGAAIALALQVATTRIEPLAGILRVAPLAGGDWLVIVIASAVPAVVGQMLKMGHGRRSRR